VSDLVASCRDSFRGVMARTLLPAVLALLAWGFACSSDSTPVSVSGANSGNAGEHVGGASGSSSTAGGGQATAAGGQGGSSAGALPNAGSGGAEAGAPGAGGAPPAASCDSATPEACWRGLYLSPYTDHSGQVTFAGETAQHLYILDDAQKRELVLDFIEDQSINSLALYDLATILEDADLKAALVSFVEQARLRGVVEVNAIGSLSKPAWDAIATTQTESPLFDGLVTEIEFWNASATFEEFQDIAAYVRTLNMKTPDGAPMPLAAYIGRPTPEQVAPLLSLVDRVFVHVYVKSAELAYGYGQERFAAIAEANTALGTDVEVRPIFSAEGEMWAAGDEHFMGEWLSTHSLGEAETTFIAAWGNEPGALPPLTGFQYYDYFFLEQYLP
jgi:hypothetical protein